MNHVTHNKLNIKKGDQVKVLAGKDKGKTGKVLQVLPTIRRVVVEGINVHVRFSKPRKKGEKGQRMEFPASMPVSKVMLVCPHCGKTTRLGHDLESHLRKCKKCGQLIS